MTVQTTSDIPEFIRPELHGPSALSLDRLVDFHLEHNPDYPFARLTPRHDEVLTVTWRELSEAVHRAGHAFKASIGVFDASSPPVVGLLIPDDGLPYITTQLALARIGLIPLSISHRNSTAAMSHLISSTSCSYIVAAEHHIVRREHYDALGQQITTLQLLSEHQSIKMIPQPSLDVLFPRLASPGKPFIPDPELELLPPVTARPSWSTVMILHSSGSTKFPKPIHLHRTAFQEWLCAPGDASPPVTGMTISSMAWPKFHAGGVMACLVPTIAAGMIAGIFYPALAGETVPQITSEAVYDACLATGVTFLYLPPLTITEFSKSSHGLKLLQSVKLVLIGGGPLAKEVGDAIVEQGVVLASFWGSTEVGYTVEWPPRPQGLDWQWQVPRNGVDFHFEPFHEDLYEIVIKSCPTHHPSIPRALNGDEPTDWQSHDVCQLHPTRTGQFRILGRTDDQIMLSNAEKTNPGPMEETIQSDARIRGALMFGRGKPFNGVLIEPSSGNEVDTNDLAALQAYLDLIWPSIEAANSLGPSHSRLVRDLVIVIDPRKTPLPRTPKHTIIRSATWRQFASEIEQAYIAIEDDERAGSSGNALTLEDVPRYVKETVNGVMSVPMLREDQDLFLQGCDSLKATFIRQALVRKLKGRRNGENKIEVPQLIVYDCPTVECLTAWVQAALSGPRNSDALKDIETRVAAIQELADKYSIFHLSNGHVALNGDVTTNGQVSANEHVNGNNGDVTTNGHVASNGQVSANEPINGNNGDVTTNGHVTSNGQVSANEPINGNNGYVTINGHVAPNGQVSANGHVNGNIELLSRGVLITGTTGSLGSHMLHQLAQDTRVARIYALGRASDTKHLRERQRSALEGRGLSGEILKNPKIVLIPAETLDNVPEETLEEIKHNVTHIFHVSYPLNFNLGIAAFEPQVAFVHFLVKLALSSRRTEKPRIVFASSASSLQNWDKEDWVPEEKVKVGTAVGTGYGESKRACELVLESAASLGLKVVIVRIGQLCGSRTSGDWNVTDWVPIIVASCQELGCLPDSESVCAWLPTDTAATSMIQLGFHKSSDSQNVVYRHLFHPHVVPWRRLMLHLSTLCAKFLGHAIELVPAEQWVDKVQSAALRPGDAMKVKAVKLMGMWAAGVLSTNAKPGREAYNIPRMDTTVTEGEIPALRECKPLEEVDVEKWFTHWLKNSLFSMA